MGKVFEIFNAIFYKGLLIVALICFMAELNLYGLIVIVSFFFALFFDQVIKKVEINKAYRTIMYFMIWANILGEFYFYTNVFYYDKILHFVIPVFIASMVYDYTKKFNLEFQILQVFLMVMGMLCLFEIFEYFVDLFLNYGMQRVMVVGEIRLSALHDTFWDLIFGALGTGSFLLYRRKNA